MTRESMKRTTIMADESLILEAKHLAEQEGRTFNAVVQDALREYLATTKGWDSARAPATSHR
jgi:predicted transcriptional regulator